MVHLHMKIHLNCVKSEVLSLVTMKISHLLNVTSGSLVDIYQIFRDTWYLNLQDRRLLWRFGGMCWPRLDIPRRLEVLVLSKTVVFFFTRLQGVMSQKIVILMFTAFRTSTLSYFTYLKWSDVTFALSRKGCLTWLTARNVSSGL